MDNNFVRFSRNGRFDVVGHIVNGGSRKGLYIWNENCLLLKLYRKLRKMFLSPRRESNLQPTDLWWDALTIELPGLRWQREGHDMYRFVSATCLMHVLLNSSLDMSVYLINEYQICMKDDLQLGKLKENCLLLKLYHKQKNVSEPQTGIEPAIFWSPVRRSISSETVRLISGETFLGLRNIFLSLR